MNSNQQPMAASVLTEAPLSVNEESRSIDKGRFQALLARHVAVPLAFGLVSVLFFIVIVNYLLTLGRWVEATDRIIGSSNLLLQLFIDHETGSRGFVITGRDEFLEPYLNAQRRVQPLIMTLKQQVADNEQQKQRLDSMYDNYLRWREVAEAAIDLKRTGKSLDTIIASGRGKRLMDEMRRQSGEFIAEEESIKADRNESAHTWVVGLASGYFALSLLFSALMAYWGRKQLLELATTYGGLLQRQVLQTDVLRQQAWLRSGQSRMADKIIGQLPLPILGQNILTFLAEYLDVAVGAVYISPDEKTFNRIATYGFSREMADLEQTFEPGESLLGQVVEQRSPLFLDGVASSYFKVNSGLGEGNPAAVAILPVISDNTINAVLELGFLRAISPRDIEFLNLVSENIGAAVVAATYRRRLHETLIDMQQLNDELQAQQEELRIANEELEEQSQSLEESQARLEAQQTELEQTNVVLEEQHEDLRNNNETLQQTQQLLEDHASQLEKASRYKSEFLANMSHELRTPLNSSLILSKLLADNSAGNLTPEQVKFAESIYAAGNDLLVLINDVLDISKVEAGKLEVKPDQIALPRILEALTQNFRTLAQQKHLEFELIVDADAPTTLYADRHRLEQILRNLLSNAIKFTERGSVLLRVSAPAPERVSFAVIDTGIGVNANQIGHIFEPFYQADSATNRKYGGTGLGLSISRQLASLLDGHLTVTSEVDAGSIFTLDIPVSYQRSETAAPAEAIVEPSRPAVIARKATATFDDDRNRLVADKKIILIVEDDPAFAQILYDLAHELNYQCLVAASAEDGIELTQQHTPHAVLLDMKLPDQSGMSVLARFKDEPRIRHVPVHIISVEDRTEAALHMGAVGYLVKPVSRDQLRDIFVSIEAKIAQKMKHVLVVEAAGESSGATAALIADVDVEVVTVTSGEQALNLLKDKTFDCLIVDLMLPDMGSDELLKKMSATETLSFPPVIVHASRNLSREEEEKLLRYSRSIIIKGARSPERLLDEVTLFLHKVEADLSAERRSMLRLARSRDRALEGRKILVVDDDVRNIFAITSALENKGAVIEIGRNGVDALRKLDESADIDLVLMDIMMPEMDGYQAMQAIRKDSRFSKLPIIAVTARAMRDDQERCLRAGANDYVAKPVDMDRLISLIRVWLPKIQRI
ncbi:MAG: multi-sensor hybrid histidine kinase [Verrucomicrobiaceae bacterium]|nr:multi-sensor hybrid histidine kinase [Verrucomicrobiaceae bacterium]